MGKTKEMPRQGINDVLAEQVLFEEEKLRKIQRTLGKWFRFAYDGRIDMGKLYEKGKELEEQALEVCPDFFDRKNHSDLKEALGFIDALHDSSTIQYHSQHREEIYHYMRVLS